MHLTSGDAPYAQTIRAGHHTLVADEPHGGGGADAGPTPYALLLSGLAACTAITLQMYAARKGFTLGPLHLELTFHKHGDDERIDRKIVFAPSLTDAQRTRLAEIAEKTPVTKTVKRATPIRRPSSC